MKSFFLKSISPLVVLLLLITIGCKKDDFLSTDERLQDAHLDDVPEEIQNLLSSMGINPCHVENVDGGYIADKGLFFSHETINTLLESAEQIMHSDQVDNRSRATTSNLVLPFSIMSTAIPYYIDSNFPSSWVSQITAAADEWTAISNCAITFTRVTTPIINGNGVNILRDFNEMLPSAMQNLCCAVGAISCSSNGVTTGRFISIDAEDPLFNEGYNRKRGSVKKQLGHVIGFRTNYGTPNGYVYVDDCGVEWTNNYIPGTTTSPSEYSVMRIGQILDNWVFNTDDIRGARALYPQSCQAPTITSASVTNIAGGLRKITIIANVPGGTYMQARAKLVKGNITTYGPYVYQVGPSNSVQFEVTTPPLGIADVAVTVSNYRGDCSLTSTLFYVFVP